MSLSKKIDFAVIFSVKNANPNGDPLNSNRPRISDDGKGEVTDVCIKRKLRDRILELSQKKDAKPGLDIFVQSDDRKVDGATSLRNRAETALGKKLAEIDLVKIACEKWFDVRTFGQLFAFGGEKKGEGTGVSVGIRGPVTIQSAFSVEPVNITSTQITKSVSGEDTKGGKKAADTMGMKHRIDSGVYVFFGSMNPQLSERTGFSDEDAEVIKSMLPRMFENDASSARPEGSMKVLRLIWWEHNCKSGQYSSARVHGSLKVNGDGTYELTDLDRLKPEEIEGF
ncbi:MAG: type I-C CRISPR-associated protein Cas7/Csd2 [Synergistaceae bacterium]|jgi:CRISPR-associated protein Csd2|nr:type I-C CRISPR-associated protein Cas7/Csd2 [Synergistaceae bacterium]